MSFADLAIHMSSNDLGRPSTIEMDDGRLLLCGWKVFFVSHDRGLTWQESFTGKDTNGDLVESSDMSIVRLPGNGIGVHGIDLKRGYGEGSRHLFWRSQDGGQTWSPPVQINPPTMHARGFHDTMIRTSSGRLVAPFYLAMRLGPWFDRATGKLREEDTPIDGTLLNGMFVSTSCHNWDAAFGACYTCHSDDDGRTWQPNENGYIFINWEAGSLYGSVFEPSIVEVSPRRLLMFMRTGLGRLFQSWSQDDGTTWSRPAPTNLASSHSPAQLRRMPNGHLLCIWNQQSEEEIRRGFIRTRISTAISRNGGIIWEHFQNLESMHEEIRVEPGPIRPTRPGSVYCFSGRIPDERHGEFVTDLPAGYTSCSYPTALVCADRVLIRHSNSYDVNELGDRIELDRGYKVLPLKWFYGGREPFENLNIPKDPNAPAEP